MHIISLQRKALIVLCVLLQVFLTSSCKINRYYYTSSKPFEVYESGYASTRYQDIPAGDTIYIERNWINGAAPSTLFDEYAVYKKYRLKVRDTGPIKYLYKRAISNKESKADINKLLSLESYPKHTKQPYNKSVTELPSGSSGNSHSIQTGPRGGRYYINSNGNKTYIKKK